MRTLGYPFILLIRFFAFLSSQYGLLAYAIQIVQILLVLGLLSFAWHGTAGGILLVLAVVVALLGITLLIWSAKSLGRSFTPFATLPDRAKLTTGGAFRYVRHPMYLALLMLGVAAVFRAGDVTSIYNWVALLIVLLWKMTIEERQLAARFEGYEQYRNTTGALIPKRQKSR